MIRTLGTPSEENWPGVSKLPDFKPIFPVWKNNILEALVKPMEQDAIDLLNVSFYKINLIKKNLINCFNLFFLADVYL